MCGERVLVIPANTNSQLGRTSGAIQEVVKDKRSPETGMAPWRWQSV